MVEEGEQPGTDPEPQPTEQTVTFVTSEQGYSDTQKITDVNYQGITFTFSKANGSTDPAYYTSGTAIRCYAKNTIKVSANGGTISKIEITFAGTASNNGASFSSNINTYEGNTSSGTWTGSAEEVIFTLGDSGQRRIGSISVTYTGTPSSDTPGSEGPSVDPTPTPDPTPGPATSFISDDIFTKNIEIQNSVEMLSETTIDGQSATGFKLGSGSKNGVVTSDDLGISGNATLSFYAFGWTGKTGGTVTIQLNDNDGMTGTVDGETGEKTFNLTANDGVTGTTAKYTITTNGDSSYRFDVKLTGVTPTSTLVFSTNEKASEKRAILAGIHLTQD